MAVHYKINESITVDEFAALLRHTALAGRRPLDEPDCLEGMLKHSNLLVTAWDEGELIGVARSMTDFHFACYLSDLAVHERCQKGGVGKQLIEHTWDQLGPRCKLILVAAPSAMGYYEHLGFEHHPQCWMRPARNRLV